MTQNFRIVIDSREQTPFVFNDNWPVETGALASGDYSIVGLTDFVAIERKSLSDLCSCVVAVNARGLSANYIGYKRIGVGL
jgi:ERCC4-type nuclease